MKSYTSTITGGAGFIGSHLTERLLKEGHKNAIIDNFSSGRLENIQNLLANPSLTLVTEDFKNPNQLKQIVKKMRNSLSSCSQSRSKSWRNRPKSSF